MWNCINNVIALEALQYSWVKRKTCFAIPYSPYLTDSVENRIWKSIWVWLHLPLHSRSPVRLSGDDFCFYYYYYCCCRIWFLRFISYCLEVDVHKLCIIRPADLQNVHVCMHICIYSQLRKAVLRQKPLCQFFFFPVFNFKPKSSVCGLNILHAS